MSEATATAERRVPSLPGIDHTLGLWFDPYRFIGSACRTAGSDVVQARFLGRRTLCMTGAATAEIFYDKSLFQRAGAAPEPARATLFGKGGVQGLDGEAHLQRKRFFLQATSPQRVQQLALEAEAQWMRLAPQWQRAGRFSLYEATQHWLTRSVCGWAGVPLDDAEEPVRTRHLVALFDKAASGLAAHWQARRARYHAEAWLAALVEQARAGRGVFREGSVAHEAAMLVNGHDAPLEPRIAAVELLNVLRPTVATSLYIVHSAHALQGHPWLRDALRGGGEAAMHSFAQEVRRFYPFFPALAARVREDFVWNGFRFPRGTRVMLDIYGTNRDPRRWEHPDEFQPQRFVGHAPGRFDFIPQGGSTAESDHRCPGEGVVLALMELALRLLLRANYHVPAQDLEIRMDRMPAIPASGFVIERFTA
ncbi:cytochrome P450 [Piscinibacter koreensis]|uniref:Cytochrome P450 n=1 Tax=Piscinibacter koreensis TaxID=2742824 RepID=A0A7Y6NSD5_9BURK|nr:cytochrome P450 [Schlegelella koreensis]NUZ08413.1 cytochrome P450 [Schlegelella koreensis]